MSRSELISSRGAQLAARRPKPSRLGAILAGSAAALAAAAAYNVYRARRAERDHPPSGRFVTVDGVRLHYLEEGDGLPVVLLHGNVVTAEDFVLSGVFERLARGHRVISIDRPGYGYSDRPQGSVWTAAAQAGLLRKALDRLAVERPVVVGHSWGTLVALELALAQPDAVRGLVLLSGYYKPTVRADVPLAAPAAVPVVGDLLRYTVSPLVGRALLPLTLKGMFAPLEVPARFQREFPRDFPTRPGQIRAEAQDAVTMTPGVVGMAERARDLRLPITIVAGMEDLVVGHHGHAEWFHDQLPGSTLHLVPGAGHMVHHAAPDQVVEAIAAIPAQSPLAAE
ncbi:alpha/beta hydrolase [Azospirillum sp. SYSU D00513]|uniref:alpha/beta fold hydrolase n=1 Tax=Azospirillum sp. SYSU D00513 TaxID=2812561 RepID=UPI001A962D3C